MNSFLLPDQPMETLEHRVHVTGVGGEVEDGGEVEAAGQLGICRDDVAERPLLLPCPHGGLLDAYVRLVARKSRLDEREQHALAEEETVARLQVLPHSLRAHHESLDEPGEPFEHV